MAKSPAALKPAGVTDAVRPPLFTIQPIQRRQRYLKLLIYGNYGVGKTHLAGTSSEVKGMQDVILINAEAGDLTLEAFSGIDEVGVQNFKTLARVYEYLKAHCVARDAGDEEKLSSLQEKVGLKGETKRYKTVIVDSLSEVEQYSFNQLLGVHDSTKLDEEVMGAEFKEYKQNHSMVLRMVRNFRNLPMNVIFTCAEAYTQDETKKMKYTLDLTGKLSKKVQGFMDMVGYYIIIPPKEEGSAVQRRLYVMPSSRGKYDAKHRYTAFKGTHFENPTISSILEASGLIDGSAAIKGS